MAKIAPDMIKLESYRTVYGLVAKYVKDERLRQVLSFHPLLVGGNPFSTTSIYTLIAFLERKWGVHFPMGGTGALVRGLVGLIEGQGSSVRCNAEVKRSWSSRTAPREVGAQLGGELRSADRGVERRRRVDLQTPRRSRRSSPLDRRANRALALLDGPVRLVLRHEPALPRRRAPHHPARAPLQGLLDDIFERHVLAEDFSLYLHRPTATDPSLAPDGCEAFYVLSPVPNLASGTDWEREAEPYRQRLQAHLEATVLPGLGESLVTSRVTTPLDFQNRLLSYRGAAFSFEPVLTQSAYFRPHNRSEDVRGLYLVGAGTHPGAGVPGVLSSARVLDQVVPDASVFATA
jgi:phytoene desaturase